jgi:hypothetical protein
MFTDAEKRKYRNDDSVFVGERGVFSVSAKYAWEGLEFGTTHPYAHQKGCLIFKESIQ